MIYNVLFISAYGLVKIIVEHYFHAVRSHHYDNTTKKYTNYIYHDNFVRIDIEFTLFYLRILKIILYIGKSAKTWFTASTNINTHLRL